MRAPKRMFLVPATGRRVRAYHDLLRFREKPPRCYLAEGGENVPMVLEYHRALNCGDLSKGKPPKASKPKGS